MKEYQVSESMNADRQYFSNYKDAAKEARQLSTKQINPVYIDVFNKENEDMEDYHYTVTNLKITKVL